MSLETWQAKYPTISFYGLENRTLKESVRIRQETNPKGYVWSARLSTGLFGRHDCPSGNGIHAPKGETEVLIGVGDDGLLGLIDLGFIPCPKCRPEDSPDFWEKVSGAVKRNYYELTDVHQFVDKSKIPFDSRRVNWEALAPYLKILPNRLYVPEGLDRESLKIIKARFVDFLGYNLPPVGYRLSNTPWFREYEMNDI